MDSITNYFLRYFEFVELNTKSKDRPGIVRKRRFKPAESNFRTPAFH